MNHSSKKALFKLILEESTEEEEATLLKSVKKELDERKEKILSTENVTLSLRHYDSPGSCSYSHN